MDDEFRIEQPIDLTVASLDDGIDIIERDKSALEPVRISLREAGYYAYTTYDDQQRWTVAVDDEAGRVDVRVGMDGYEIDLCSSSPGMFADEENEWKRRTMARLVRIVLPNIARGLLEEHQSATWSEDDRGVAVCIHHSISLEEAGRIPAIARQNLDSLDALLTRVESELRS